MAVKKLDYIVSGLLAALLMGCTHDTALSPLQKVEASTPQYIALELYGYKAGTGRKFHNLFVSNFSVKAERGNLAYSTARDGMPDELKRATMPTYGFGVNLPDTSGNGFSDLVKFTAGINLINQPALYCNPSKMFSTSNDAFTYTDTRLAGEPKIFIGLRDCEKSFLQMDPSKFDNDKDGIPDYLEIRAGLNPRNAADANLIASDDGKPNIEKVKENIPIDENAKSQTSKVFAYKYQTQIDASGVRIFNVSNIPVVNSGVDNFIAFYLTETDQVTQVDTLFSAFMIIHKGAAGTSIRVPYWATSPSASPTNQEILQP
jgi:hypothetical protein